MTTTNDKHHSLPLLLSFLKPAGKLLFGTALKKALATSTPGVRSWPDPRFQLPGRVPPITYTRNHSYTAEETPERQGGHKAERKKNIRFVRCTEASKASLCLAASALVFGMRTNSNCLCRIAHHPEVPAHAPPTYIELHTGFFVKLTSISSIKSQQQSPSRNPAVPLRHL